PLESFIAFLITSAAYVISIIIALNQLGIAAAVFKVISAVIVFLLLVSMGLYIKDILPNFFAGINIISTRKIRVGDHLKIDDRTEGDVVRVDITEICLKGAEGELIYVPPALIQKSKVEIRKKIG
ncbi:MAG: mechanosensitive ion channel, partial [Candidatus Micrarchaeia archaeon]